MPPCRQGYARQLGDRRGDETRSLVPGKRHGEHANGGELGAAALAAEAAGKCLGGQGGIGDSQLDSRVNGDVAEMGAVIGYRSFSRP